MSEKEAVNFEGSYVEISDEGVSFFSGAGPTQELHAGERLGTMIRRKREAKGMSIEETAAKLPIGEGAYVRIENGRNEKPPQDILKAIAKVLDLNADELKKVAALDYEVPVERFMF